MILTKFDYVLKKAGISKPLDLTYRRWPKLWLRHSGPRNSSSSKLREARKARRKALGKEQVCESSEWLFLILYHFTQWSTKVSTAKSQLKHGCLQIQSRRRTDVKTLSCETTRSDVLGRGSVFGSEVWALHLCEIRKAGKEIHRSLQIKCTCASCVATQRTVKTPLILDIPMKTLTILRSTRISHFQPRSSNFLQKQESVSRCVSVSFWQLPSEEWTWSLTCKSCNFNALQTYLKIVLTKI